MLRQVLKEASMHWFAMCLFLSAPPTPAHQATPSVSVLPVKHLDIRPLELPGWPVRHRDPFWLRIEVAGGTQEICDPFGRFDTECSTPLTPKLSLSGGGTRWGVWASGGRYLLDMNGKFGEATARGKFFSIGPVAIGATIELASQTWQRDVFTSDSTVIGTSRHVKAGFMGVDLRVGRFDRQYVSLAVLPGFWKSSYMGTANTGEPPQELAHQEYVLLRVRVEAHTISVTNRMEVSGSLERTSFYRNERHPTAAPFAPAVQWAFTPSASYRLWSPSRHATFTTTLRLTVTAPGPSQLRERGVDLGLAWRFK